MLEVFIPLLKYVVPVLIVAVVGSAVLAYMKSGSGDRGERYPKVAKSLKDPDLQINLQPVMNRTEQNIMAELLIVLDDKLGRDDLNIYPQVSLGGVFELRGSERGTRTAAFNSFKSKRFDYLIAANDGTPVMAIEYNGTGHSGNDHQKRDDTKRLVSQRAGLPLIFIEHPKTPLDYIDQIQAGLGN